MNYSKVRGAHRARLLDQAERIVENYDVFLAGPFVLVDQPSNAPENSTSSAKALRYDLYQKLTAAEHRVYLGEDVELRLNGEAHYGPLANAVVYERHHIIQRIDALIVLPSSPGSFCEFGDWASAPEICKKMLVLVDSQHEGQVNYINEGVTKFAASNGAQVEYCDYKNFQQAFDKCERFLELMAASLRIESLYGRVRR